jgi:hypothetical protein
LCPSAATDIASGGLWFHIIRHRLSG